MPEEPKFTYAVTPHEVYVTRDPHSPSLASLDVGVANRSGEAVDCEWIAFTLPVGTGPSDLTPDAGSISLESSQPAQWEIGAVGDGQYRAVPVAPNQGLAAGGGVSFRLSNVVINEQLGLSKIRVVEQTGERGTTALDVNKIRADLEIVYFQAAPPEIEPGGSSTLSWQTRGAASAVITWPGGRYEVGADEIGKGSYRVAPERGTKYTLTVSGGTGPDRSRQTLVDVEEVRIDYFRASHYSVVRGDEAILSWKTAFAERAELEGQQVPLTGEKTVSPMSSKTYTLVAISPAGERLPAQRTINVVPRVVEFTAGEPAEIGEQVRLEWKVEGALECTLSRTAMGSHRAIAVDPVAGSLTLPYLGMHDETFTLTCRGESGENRATTIKQWQPVGDYRVWIRAWVSDEIHLHPGQIYWKAETNGTRVEFLIGIFPTAGSPEGRFASQTFETPNVSWIHQNPAGGWYVISATDRDGRNSRYEQAAYPWDERAADTQR